MCKLADWIVLGMLGYLAWCDWKTKEIPVVGIMIFNAASIGLTLLCRDKNLGTIVGGVVLGIFFLFVSKFSKEAIGYGDSWVILALGIYLGGKKLLYVMFAASFFAAICSLICMWKNHWKRDMTLPFLPFMAAAYVGALWL